MKIIIKDIIIAVLVVTLIAAFVVSIIEGLHKAEQVKCYTLQEQSREYPDFFLTIYEKEMCDFHGIEITAPVR